MTARSRALLLAVCLATGVVGVAGDRGAPETGVTVERTRGALRLDAVLPGRVGYIRITTFQEDTGESDSDCQD